MTRHRFPAGRDLWFGRALAALALASVCPLSAVGAERMVLCEEFTESG